RRRGGHGEALLLLGPRPAAEQQVPPGDAAVARAAPLTGGLLFRDFNDFDQVLPAGAGALEQVEGRRHGAIHLVGNVSLREGATRAVDRKSTRLNSSHVSISYAVFCLKKKTTTPPEQEHAPDVDVHP